MSERNTEVLRLLREAQTLCSDIIQDGADIASIGIYVGPDLHEYEDNLILLRSGIDKVSARIGDTASYEELDDWDKFYSLRVGNFEIQQLADEEEDEDEYEM